MPPRQRADPRQAAGAGLLGGDLRDLLVLVVTLSMVTTPVLLALRDRMARPVAPSGPAREFDRDLPADSAVIIAGLGRFGQVVARVLTLRGVAITALEANPEQVDFVRRFGGTIHYGDATRLELLRAAGTERATLFVLAIDDPQASLRTAETVRKHFPHVPILARARNRLHAFGLMELGVPFIVREMFHSSLHLAEQALVRLGQERGAARDMILRFAERDEALLKAQQPYHQNPTEFLNFTRAQAKLLEEMFEADRQQPQSRTG